MQSLALYAGRGSVVEFRLAHESELAEAGAPCAKCMPRLKTVAFEAQARLLAAGPMGRC